MEKFNMKQWLIENKSGMYSKVQLSEHRLEDATILGSEIAKAHPELIDFKLNRETKKYQDAIFKYAGELLRDANVTLSTVRGLANDYDWAMELVSAVGDELEHGGDEGDKKDMPGFGGTWDALNKLSINEIHPALLGVGQEEADNQMQQQDDQNGDMVDNVSMGLEENVGKTAEIDIKEEPFYVLGKEYMVDGVITATTTPDEEGYVIDDASIKITELHIEHGNEYRQIQDPVAIKTVEDLINTDPKLNLTLKDIVVDKGIEFGEPDVDDYEPEMDEQIGVGYVSKVKSPEDKPFFPGN